MQIEINRNQFVTIKPKGELDANSSLDMNKAIQSELAANNVLLNIDCNDLEYITSAGLGVFLSNMEELRLKNGKMVFSNMSPKVYDVFQLLGLHQLFVIVSTTKEAEACLI